MTPYRLILDQPTPFYSSDTVATGNCKAEELFKEYLHSWKKLAEKRSFLIDFLEINSISDFSKEDIYCLEKILNKAFVLHGESEFIAGTKYFESFTIVLPTEKENIGRKYKKSYSHSYMLGATKSRSFYISYGLFGDHSKPISHRYRISNFYLNDSNVKLSLEDFNKRGFWFNAFDENFIAIFKSIIRTFNGEFSRTVTERKQSFLKSVFSVVFKESLSKLSFNMIKDDFQAYFRAFHGDALDLFDPNLLNIVVKQRYDRFLKNPNLVLEEGHLNPTVDTRYTCVVFDTLSGDPQNDFFNSILCKIISNPYAYEKILNYKNKEELLLDILRSQFALNYLGKIYFSASYLIENRNNPKKNSLNLLGYNKDSLTSSRSCEIFNKLYPDLVNYLKLNFS